MMEETEQTEQQGTEKGPNPNRRQTRMSRRRKDILKVAARYFAEVGYERTTLEMIASELGLTQPALYYYVAKKEDVLALLLEDIIQGIITRAQQDILPEMPPDQQLECLIKAHVFNICQYPEGKAFIFYESHLLSQRRPEIQEMRDRYQQIVESILKEGVKQGIFHIEDVKLATFALLGSLNWIPRWYSPEGRLTPDMIGDHYAHMLIRAMMMPPTSRQET